MGAMRSRDIPWPVRSVVAGAAGTAAMSLAYGSERRVRHATSSLDYDDSLVPGRIVGTILHLPDVTDREAAELGMALRWGYGSAFGLWHDFLRRRLPEPWATLIFGGHPDVRDADPLPRARPHSTPLALATGRDRDEHRHARRVHAHGRARRRRHTPGVSLATPTPSLVAAARK